MEEINPYDLYFLALEWNCSAILWTFTRNAPNFAQGNNSLKLRKSFHDDVFIWQICLSDNLNGALSSLALNNLFGTIFSSPLTEQEYYFYLDLGKSDII